MTQVRDAVAEVDWESEHITYRSIWHAAQVLREAGEKNQSNGFWSLMAATVLVSTAYEGFANDLIERLFPEVWQDDAAYFRTGRFRGTLGKTRFLAERLDVALKRACRPYRTVAELVSWRNDLVHPKTVHLRGTMRADAYAKKPRHAKPMAFTKLERPTLVLRSFEDVSALGDTLLSAAAEKHWTAVRDLGSSAFSGALGSGRASLKQ